MSVPNWYELALLSLAAFRSWVLLAEDTIFDRPRGYVIRKGGDNIEAFLTCPWCSGFWVALCWWAGWQLWPHGSLVAAAVVALTALVPIIERITSD